jgi:hypothetical protein
MDVHPERTMDMVHFEEAVKLGRVSSATILTNSGSPSSSQRGPSVSRAHNLVATASSGPERRPIVMAFEALAAEDEPLLPLYPIHALRV